MKHGILVTCADDIELYNIAEEESIGFDKPGFTALAHPSPLSIGTTHGVFVLEQNETSATAEMESIFCLHFLHKPSINRMRGSGAVCKRHSALGPKATIAYTNNTVNITKQEKSLVKICQKICIGLRGTQLNVILLNNTFDHIGTTTEYLYHLTEDPVLRSELGFLSCLQCVSERSL